MKKQLRDRFQLAQLACLLIAVAFLVFSAFKPNSADLCIESKAKVELLNVCTEEKSCMYSPEYLHDVVRSVARCEAAKASE